jgi:hypothetical protein
MLTDFLSASIVISKVTLVTTSDVVLLDTSIVDPLVTVPASPSQSVILAV